MRLPRPRFTVRRLVVAVAIVGMILWGFRLRQWSIHYRSEVERCENRLLAMGVFCYFDSGRLSPEENAKRKEAHWKWVERYGAHYEKLKK